MFDKNKYQRKYYQKNKEKYRKWHKEYRQKNRGSILEYQKEFYEKNKEKKKEQQRKYEQNNKEKIKERKQKYYQKNKRKMQERNRKYRQEKKESWKQLIRECYGIKQIKCSICGFDGEKHFEAIDFHHRNPKVKKFNISRGFHFPLTSKRVEAMKEEFKKCVILCRNCHTILHYQSSTSSIL